MDATSARFLLFALAAGLLYNCGKPVFWRQAVLLAANLVFLASIGTHWRDYLPLAAFVLTGYAGLLLMQSRRWRGLFLPVISAVILLYIWLKRYAFLPNSLFLPFPYITIGLSYIFFRVVHMIVDARDESLTDRVALVPYLNYTLNFTSIVAGPIQLYPQFAESQLSPVRPPLTLAQCARAVERVAIGFFKLRVVSSILLAMQQAAIARLSAGQGSREKLLVACLIPTLYTFYLYFNFSGFIDLMIGAARVFRLELPENFARPFSAASFLEFWSRWHMSLSNWWKTYVYTPLVKGLMNRFPSAQVEPFLGVIGFFITFFFVGVWHGQTSEFLCFGLLQGGGVSLNKLYQIVMSKSLGRKRYKVLDSNGLYRAFSRGLTFTYFTFTLIWFWSTWQQICHLAAALTFTQQVAAWMGIWLGSIVALAAWDALRQRALQIEWDGSSILKAAPVRVAWVAYVTVLTLITLSIVTVSTAVVYQIF